MLLFNVFGLLFFGMFGFGALGASVYQWVEKDDNEGTFGRVVGTIILLAIGFLFLRIAYTRLLLIF